MPGKLHRLIGNETLTGLDGNDVFSGGLGTDTVDYSVRIAPIGAAGINASIDGVANDGAAGENDFIGADVENVLGGSGNDVITGNVSTNALNGGAGDDTLTGGAAADTLTGADGNDTINAIDGVIDTIGDHVGTDVLNKDSNDIVL